MSDTTLHFSCANLNRCPPLHGHGPQGMEGMEAAPEPTSDMGGGLRHALTGGAVGLMDIAFVYPLAVLATRRRLLDERVSLVQRHCLGCCAVRAGPVECRNLDCPHLYARLKLERQRATAVAHAQVVDEW